MKVCQIIFTFPPHALGGADIYAHHISMGLKDAGHEVTVITTRLYDGPGSLKPRVEYIDGIKAYRFYPLNVYTWIDPARSLIKKLVWHTLDLWNPHPYLVIRDILKKERPDVVHIHTPIWLSMSIFSAVKSLSIPAVFSLHDSYLVCRKGTLIHGNGRACTDPRFVCRIYRWYTRRLVNASVDVTAAPSNFILSSLANKGYFNGLESQVIPLGMELKGEKPRKSYDPIHIIYVGATLELKGLFVLIGAFKKLKHDSLILDIVGRGADLERLVQLANGDGRIIFHGFRSGMELDRLWDRANITVLPSLGPETFGVAIVESFSHATPAIVSRIGAYPELIEAGTNGFLFEPGNVSQLADILEKTINDLPLLKRLEEGAFASAKKYGLKGHVAKLENCYTRAIDRRFNSSR